MSRNSGRHQAGRNTAGVATPVAAPVARLRLDKWLWQARFCKTRADASRLCAVGIIRLDGQHVTKAHAQVAPGQVLVFPQGHRIRIVRILALGTRRGPAREAATLYEDLQPQPGAASDPAEDDDDEDASADDNAGVDEPEELP